MKVWNVAEVEAERPKTAIDALRLLDPKNGMLVVALARMELRQRPEELLADGELRRFVEEQLERPIRMRELVRRADSLKRLTGRRRQ